MISKEQIMGFLGKYEVSGGQRRERFPLTRHIFPGDVTGKEVE
jgi:hypothetical protein